MTLHEHTSYDLHAFGGAVAHCVALDRVCVNVIYVVLVLGGLGGLSTGSRTRGGSAAARVRLRSVIPTNQAAPHSQRDVSASCRREGSRYRLRLHFAQSFARARRLWPSRSGPRVWQQLILHRHSGVLRHRQPTPTTIRQNYSGMARACPSVADVGLWLHHR